MRHTALCSLLALGALTLSGAKSARADCSAPTAPCVDAEPMWLSPSAVRFAFISDARSPALGQIGLGASLSFRLRPAVLTVPAPNRDGRDVNVLRHATDLSLAARLGIGNHLEVTLLLPAGLYQRGAGIKGVTDQAAPAIATTAVHDPRVGFGYALGTGSRHFAAKLRFESKLPLGNVESLSGERSFVASPSFALSAEHGGFFLGAELGARLRRPTQLFGQRIGSQALVSVGAGYAFRQPQLAFAAELYLLPSLIDGGTSRYLASEWLASASWAPSHQGSLSFGLGAGSGLPFSGDAAGSSLAFGVPSFRALGFLRLTPSEQRRR